VPGIAAMYYRTHRGDGHELGDGALVSPNSIHRTIMGESGRLTIKPHRRDHDR
jgi:hypothetical protein